MPQFYLLIGMLLLMTTSSAQQCAVNPDVDIPDNGKSYRISLEANTTQSGPKLLCGVRLAFTHQFADELKFVLVSPGGKEVTLIAGKTASSKTTGSTWNILFVRSEEPAHPDDFKKQKWNENKWEENQDYIGSYYPADQNSLEIFDGENLNGVWNLIYSDGVKGGTGILKSFSLVFCDPPVSCNPCAVSRDFINKQNFGSFCGGDPALKSITPAFVPSRLTPGFDRMYIVLDGKSRIVTRGSQPDLSMLGRGSYKILGVQYRSADLNHIQNATTTKELNNLFHSLKSGVCGAVSNSSAQLTILSDPGVQNELREVYGRDYVIIDGKRITSDQSIMQSLTDQNGCDSLVNTTVEFKTYTTDFSQDNPYNCINTSINLSVKSNPTFPVHRWYTKDGRINNQSDITSNEIIVDAPGTYFVVFEIEDYLDTVAHTINTDPNSPNITLDNEYTLCSGSPLRLSIGTNFDKATVSPASKATIDENTITFHEPGLYTVNVNKACEVTKFVLVRPAGAPETVSIDDVELTCARNTAEITPDLEKTYENYSWFFEGEKISSTHTLKASAPGRYAFRAWDGNECGVTGAMLVTDRRTSVNLKITGPTLINCSNESKNNQLQADFQGDFEVSWKLPDGAEATGKKVPVNQAGDYQVTLTGSSGCIYTDIHTVVFNQEKIDFVGPDQVIIPCDSKSTEMSVIVPANIDEYSISWQGAKEGTPATSATVSEPGSVTVGVTHKISRCTVKKSIPVSLAAGSPELIIDPDLDLAITCDTPVRNIPVLFKNFDGFTPEFASDKGLVFMDSFFTASKPGTIDITLNNGTCISTYALKIPDQIKAKNPRIDKMDIGCSGQNGRIEIKNKNDYSSIIFESNSTSATAYSGPINNIAEEDSYTFYFTDRTNGCEIKKVIEITADKSVPKVEYDPVEYLQCHTGKAVMKIRGPDVSEVTWVDKDGLKTGHTSRNYEVDQPGTYYFIVHNDALCYQEGQIEVKDDRSEPSIGLSPKYTISCSASYIIPTYDTSELENVVWYGPGGWTSNEFSPKLNTGEYSVLLVGKNGCTSTQKTLVTTEEPGDIPGIIAPPITCIDSFSRVHVTDYTDIEEIQWIDENGQASVSDTFQVYNPGSISLIIQKKNGCLISTSIDIDEDKETVPFTINKPVINCHSPDPVIEAKVHKSVNRDVQYQWYFGNTPVSSAASYDIEYPGEYRVEVSYSNGCVDSKNYQVKLDTSAVEFNLLADTISCARSKIQLRQQVVSKQIAKASWSGPEGFASTAIRPTFQTPGQYQVTYAGKNGCEARTQMEIFGDLEAPKVDSVDYLSLGCNDKKVDLTFHSRDPIVTQYWQLPDGQVLEDSIIKIDAKGDYALYLEGDNGCSNIDTFPIHQTITPQFDLYIAHAGCDDYSGLAQLMPELDTFQAIWYEPDGVTELGRGPASPHLGAGSYTVTVINPYNQCDSTTVFEIKDISNILEASISIDDSLRCERNEANLMSRVYPPSENYEYHWRYENNPNPISKDSVLSKISKQGLYRLTIRDTLNQCTVQAEYKNVRAPSRLRSFDLFVKEPSCDINKPGYAIMDSLIGATDMRSITYSTNGSAYISQDTFPFLYANEPYTIAARDQYGCQIDTTIIPELRGIMDRIAQIPDTTINSGDTINFNDPAFKISYASTDAPLSEQYTWILNPDTLFCDYDCTDPIQKQLFHTRTVSTQLTNQFGCTITDTFNIYVRQADVLNIPNAIAPASSQPENANVCIYTNNYIADIELFVVFNRFGKVIFKSTHFDPRNDNQNFNHCWNGRDSQNNILPSGSYNYYVRYNTVYQTTKEKYGNIFLVR